MDEELGYDETGAGPPIVFLHGVGASRRLWDPVVAPLADRHRCIQVDLLGHGASPRGTSSSLFSQVEALAGFFERIGAGRPLLVGHDYGGLIAGAVAMAVPVAGVLTVDQRLDTAAFYDVLAPLEARLRGDDFEAAFDEFIVGQRFELIPKERRAWAMSHIQPDRDAVLEMWVALFDTPPEQLVAEVERLLPMLLAPYLAIFGSPPSARELELQAMVRNSRHEVWDGLGHFLHLVEPERFAERVAAFAAELDAPN